MEVVSLLKPSKNLLKKWQNLKQQMQNKIKNDPNSPFVKMIDKGDEIILIDKYGKKHKLVPSFIKK